MKKHRTHQIDELAQQVFRAALPATWVVNEQHRDYAKDYLVEIGENDGNLTGSSCYVQLKGQERPRFSRDGTLVRFSLEAKYAVYYLDRVRNLPVFLVVVDVLKRRGWWHFLQPTLEADPSWRKRKSVTIDLLAANNLSDTDGFRKAIEAAMRMMRLMHPESIQDAVVAQKERIRVIDPRFDVAVSLEEDNPVLGLLPREPVALRLEFTGNRSELEPKLCSLFYKGTLVHFKPGEVRVTGSALFEPLERLGGSVQLALDVPSTLTFVCKDSGGRELARLSDVPGRLTGGTHEAYYEGGLENSLFSVRLGPVGTGGGGSLSVNLKPTGWDGQRLRHLAYFEKLFQFFRVLPESAGTDVECQLDGNRVFALTLPLHQVPFASFFSRYLTSVHKARKLAEKFQVNPVWTFAAFDEDSQRDAERLYAVLFENGWTRSAPNIELAAKCRRETFRFDKAREAEGPVSVRITSTCTYTLLGEELVTQELVHDFTEMTITVRDDHAKSRKQRTRENRNQVKRARGEPVGLVLTGSPNTVMSVRRADTSSG